MTDPATEERIRTLERTLAVLREEVRTMREQMDAAGAKSTALLEAAKSGNPMTIFSALKDL